MTVLAVGDPVAPWALVIALVSLVVSAAVSVYTAHTNRRTARETAALANWPALVAALETEVDRLTARLDRLEHKDTGKGDF